MHAPKKVKRLFTWQGFFARLVGQINRQNTSTALKNTISPELVGALIPIQSVRCIWEMNLSAVLLKETETFQFREGLIA